MAVSTDGAFTDLGENQSLVSSNKAVVIVLECEYFLISHREEILRGF